MGQVRSDGEVPLIYWRSWKIDAVSLDPFHSSLRTHKLKGDLSDRYACSVTYSDRIVFKFVTNPDSEEEEILLLAISSHDEVY